MNITKIFVFGALLVIAAAAMPTDVSYAVDYYNAPQSGAPYGELGEGRQAFGGKQIVSNPCEHKTERTVSGQPLHPGHGAGST